MGEQHCFDIAQSATLNDVKKRVFKLKTFARWAKKILSDEQLCAAAQEIERGLYEADLGGGLCKSELPFEDKARVVRHVPS